MKRIALVILALGLMTLYADDFTLVQDGPLHEAYVIQEFDTLLLEKVPNQPPQNIHESAPSKDDPQTIWIPGYWAWSRKHGQYVWVSGVFRRPPPEHQWISGYWKSIDNGWVWIRGFWSATQEENLTYLHTAPPDAIDELPSRLPAGGGDYFWISGHWQFDKNAKNYVWHSGRWSAPSSDWIYVPPQYTWRESGYLFIPGFWDWPLETRGVAFADIWFGQEKSESIQYQPKNALDPFTVLQTLFPEWPSYLSLFRYAYFFHHDTLNSWAMIPPWWQWPTWWCLNSIDAWWLWWWWSHPGYPNPYWLNEELVESIPAPSESIVKLMSHVQPPPNVTPSGVVGFKKMLEAMERISGRDEPILPADPKQIVQIQEVAKPLTPKTPYLLPKAQSKPEQAPLKPTFGPSKESLKHVPQRVILPPLPKKPIPTSSSKAQAVCMESVSLLAQSSPQGPSPPEAVQEPITRPLPPHKKQIQPYRPIPLPPRTELPTHTPRSKHAPKHVTVPTERAIPQPVQPQHNLPRVPEPHELFPKADHLPSELTPPTKPLHPSALSPQTQYHIHQQNQLPYENRIQGYNFPHYRHQRTPMQTEHHDVFMSHPMNQANPQGPKAHQVPGDYSTLPDE